MVRSANGVKRRWSLRWPIRSYLPALSLISIMRFMQSLRICPTAGPNCGGYSCRVYNYGGGIKRRAYTVEPVSFGSSSIIPERNTRTAL